MKWWRYVEENLRHYHYREMWKQDIEEERLLEDQDITASTSNLSGMPRATGYHSKVEQEVLFREEAERNRMSRLKGIDMLARRVEEVLGHLAPIERSVIENTYFTIQSEQDIADKVRLTIPQCRETRKKAMRNIYQFFMGTWPPNIEPPFMNRKAEHIEAMTLIGTVCK